MQTIPPHESRQVDWFAVNAFAEPLLARGDWPILGTPAWTRLPDGDPDKWRALIDGGRLWALHLACRQEAGKQAAVDIATSTVYRHVVDTAKQWRRDLDKFYADKPWLRRCP